MTPYTGAVSQAPKHQAGYARAHADRPIRHDAFP